MKTWRTIRIGKPNFGNKQDFRRAFIENGISLSILANSMINRLDLIVAAKETEINLVKVSVAELGFAANVQPSQIYPRATKEFGLKLLSNEMALHLPLQYQDQPNDEMIVAAMDPIICAIGIVKVFRMLRRNNRSWLRSLCAKFPLGWQPDFDLVFVDPVG